MRRFWRWWGGDGLPTRGLLDAPKHQAHSAVTQQEFYCGHFTARKIKTSSVGTNLGRSKTHTPPRVMDYTDVAAAAAESLQSCPTLCDPTDGSPPGSPAPGILQAGTLEWVAISFSNASK